MHGHPRTADRLSVALSDLIEAIRAEVRSDDAPTPPARLLSIDDAAKTLGIGRTIVYSEMAAGRLASVKVGRRRLIPASAISAYIEAIAA